MPLTRMDLALARRALALKETVRAGWPRAGVEAPESVADHAWGVALLALLAAARDPALDAGRLLTIAVAHDLAEAVVGDLTPGDAASKEEKRALEAAGLEALLAGVDDAVAEALWGAWEEYEARGSREARLVADLDKVEMALQAERYAAGEGDAAPFREFLESARRRVRDPGLSDLLRE